MSETNHHGGKRKGSGRPKGSLSKRSIEAIEAVAERWPDWSPLNHFAEVANNKDLDAEIRLDAAKAAAPYVHPKPKGVELDPDALVELEGRIAEARAKAMAKEGLDPAFGLGDRLNRMHKIAEEQRANRVTISREEYDRLRVRSAVVTYQETAAPVRSQSAPEPKPAPAPEPVREAAAPGPKPMADRKPVPEAYRPVSAWPEPKQFSGLMSPDYKPFED